MVRAAWSLNALVWPCHFYDHRICSIWMNLTQVGLTLGNLKRLVLPKQSKSGSLPSLQRRLMKTRAWLVAHARFYRLLLAESHLPRRLCGSTLRWITAILPSAFYDAVSIRMFKLLPGGAWAWCDASRCPGIVECRPERV